MASYSDLWFALFEGTIDAQQTQRGVDFLVRQLPRPEFTALLDAGGINPPRLRGCTERWLLA